MSRYCGLAQHQPITDWLGALSEPRKGAERGVGLEVIGRVLQRLLIARPGLPAQTDLALGNMLDRPKELGVATVARAVKSLESGAILTRGEPRADRPGRPTIPLTLASERWSVIGVHVDYQRGRVRSAWAQPFTLDLVACGEGAAAHADTDDGVNLTQAVSMIVHAVAAAADSDPHNRSVIGVGVEIGEQVHLDQVMVIDDAHPPEFGHVDMGKLVYDQLANLDRWRAGSPPAVVIENDANARAIEFTFQAGHPSFSMIAVFDAGVGAATVTLNRLIRGASGGAGEIGHLTVDPAGAAEAAGFREPCACGRRGHLDAIATPQAITRALGRDFVTAASARAYDDTLNATPEFRAFHHAGTALGRAISANLTMTNPGRFHLLLPSAVGGAPAGTAGAAYLQAVETEVDMALPIAVRDARQGARQLRVDLTHQSEADHDGARAGAAALMNSVVNHARGRGCLPG